MKKLFAIPAGGVKILKAYTRYLFILDFYYHNGLPIWF